MNHPLRKFLIIKEIAWSNSRYPSFKSPLYVNDILLQMCGKIVRIAFFIHITSRPNALLPTRVCMMIKQMSCRHFIRELRNMDHLAIWHQLQSSFRFYEFLDNSTNLLTNHSKVIIKAQDNEVQTWHFENKKTFLTERVEWFLFNCVFWIIWGGVIEVL